MNHREFLRAAVVAGMVFGLRNVLGCEAEPEMKDAAAEFPAWALGALEPLNWTIRTVYTDEDDEVQKELYTVWVDQVEHAHILYLDNTSSKVMRGTMTCFHRFDEDTKEWHPLPPYTDQGQKVYLRRLFGDVWEWEEIDGEEGLT